MNRRTYLQRLGSSGFAATALTNPATAQTQENETDAGNRSASNQSTGNQTDSDGGQSTISTDGGTHEVEMITESGSYYFDPIGLHVQPGDTVTFVNASGSHSATTYSTDHDLASERRIPEGAKRSSFE